MTRAIETRRGGFATIPRLTRSRAILTFSFILLSTCAMIFLRVRRSTTHAEITARAYSLQERPYYFSHFSTSLLAFISKGLCTKRWYILADLPRTDPSISFTDDKSGRRSREERSTCRRLRNYTYGYTRHCRANFTVVHSACLIRYSRVVPDPRPGFPGHPRRPVEAVRIRRFRES